MNTATNSIDDTAPTQNGVTCVARPLCVSEPRPVTSAMILLDDIVERVNYTRDLQASHVELLADSIDTVGLEQPLVLITGRQLVAGRHRLHALRMLRHRDPVRFERMFPGGAIPAQVFELGEHPDPMELMALEVTENLARINYTDEEFARTVKAFRAAGYTSKPGRPGKEDRPIGPELMRMFGMSEPTMRRALRATSAQGEKVSSDRITEPKPKPPRKTAKVEAVIDDAEVEPQDTHVEAIGQPAEIDQDSMAKTKAIVEKFSDAEFEEFAAWLSAQHRVRFG